jgi:hypothetical protein
VRIQFLVVEVDHRTVEGIFKPIHADQRIGKKTAIGGHRIGPDVGNLSGGTERNRARTAASDAIAVQFDIACGLPEVEVPPHNVQFGNVLTELETTVNLVELGRTITRPARR